MSNVATFPDVEDLLTEHLHVGSTHVGTKATGLPKFLRVERVGGVRLSIVSDAPVVVVEAWALDEAEAIELMGEARTAVHDLAGAKLGDTYVYSVTESGGLANLPDPLGKHARYTITFTIHLRGAHS